MNSHQLIRPLPSVARKTLRDPLHRLSLGYLLFAAVLLCGCHPPEQQHSLPYASSNRSAQAALRTPAGSVHDLSQDEEAGGHTLRKHVGRTDEELRERLQREPGISAASTYNDRQAAEHAVGIALDENRDRIQHWLERRKSHPNLVLDYNGNPNYPIGRSLHHGQDQSQPCSNAVVVLRWDGPDQYYVLTSYPECR